MALTISELDAKIESLVGQLSEAQSLTFADRSKTNRSATDIERAISILKAERSALVAAAENRASRFSLAVFQRG